jgi:hypothetical protein
MTTHFGAGGPAIDPEVRTSNRPVEAYQATIVDARDKAEDLVRVVDDGPAGVADYIPALLALQQAVNAEVAALLTEYVEVM